MRSWWWGAATFSVAAGLVPSVAQAHLGLAVNDLYAGMLHPLLHLASLLPMVALALWLSGCNVESLRRVIPVYLLAAVVGGVLAWWWPSLLNVEPALMVLAALTGIAAAVYRDLSPWGSLPVVAALGLALGYDNVVKVHAELSSPLLFIVGLVLVLGLVLLHITSVLYGRRQLWIQTGARVVGSWVTAVAMMMIALNSVEF